MRRQRVGAIVCLCTSYGLLLQPATGFVVPPQPRSHLRPASSSEPATSAVDAGSHLPPSLFQSIAASNEAGVRQYIAAGFDCNVADALGEPAVNLAAIQGSVGMVSALVEAGSSPNHGGFNGGDTALMQAAARGHMDVVRYLVEQAGADVNMVNHMGDTALAVACFWGQVPIVRYLLDAGADTQIRNDSGKVAGEEFDVLFEANGASDARAILHQFREERGLLEVEEPNPLLWYLEDDEQGE